MKKGIDISVHNGTVDFRKVKEAGYDFVIIRAGYGRMDNQKDRLFDENYAKAKAVGLNVGAYFYSYAKTYAEAQIEAATFLNWIKGKQFEMPVYFDIEDSSQKSLSRKVLTDICIAWCSVVEKAGYYVGIYANVDWFKNKLDLARLEKYDKWLAHWDTNTPWKGEEFGGLWQFSSKGKIGNGTFDLNKAYRDYPTVIKRAGLNGFEEVKKNIYVVQKGDTLWGIAQRCLNDGSRYTEIKRINNLTSDTIYPGQNLVIP